MVAQKKGLVSGTTRVAGVIGWPIEHTLSPAMQNCAFQHYGLDAIYIPLGVPRQGLSSLLKSLQALNAWGVNVTIPYKEAVMTSLDSLAPSASDIGAVNTIVFKQGKMIGHNTDGHGFLESLKGSIQPRAKQALLLGGGGAGRAVAFSLAKAKVQCLTIVDVDQKRLNTLIRDIKKTGFSQVFGIRPGIAALQAKTKTADLVINATPLGLKKSDSLPIPAAWIPKGRCVMDLVYGKQLTPFLQVAKKKGNVLIPGWKMLLLQGAESFRLWTNKQPPIPKMQAALIAAGELKAI
jgi:shikimate dehydrogenase